VQERFFSAERTWALFGLRWIIPAGLLLLCLPGALEQRPEMVAPTLAISMIGVASNLAIALLLLSERWSKLLTILTIVLDSILCALAVLFCGGGFAWLAAVPVAVAGFYFDWLDSLLSAVGVTAGIVLAQLLSLSNGFDLPRLLMTSGGLILLGPLTSILRSDKATISALQAQMHTHDERAQQVSRRATEYMRVVYEMAEVLAASRLDPRRVLSSAVDMSLHGLQRVGIEPPLYGVIMLFAETPDGVMLRMARSSLSVFVSDHPVTITGTGGAVGRALETLEPVVARVPSEDPELRFFETFRGCDSVLCVPLQSGAESYGILLVGSHEHDAFKDMHNEMVRAVANQAAASLHNARLYASLLQQRDRIVEVEKSAREQLAAELHDGPTQSVAAITMRLNYIRRLVERQPDAAISELYNIEDMARRATKEIRQLLFELRPKSLEQGLESGLKQLAARIEETYEQSVEVVVEKQAESYLDERTTQTLFSIANEAVNNARKHANADLIRLQVYVSDDDLVMDIRDNGIGFDVESAIEEARQREGHLGLLNLQERAALLEGTLEIDSKPGEGTRLTLFIPLESLQKRKEEIARRETTDEPEYLTHKSTGRLKLKR